MPAVTAWPLRLCLSLSGGVAAHRKERGPRRSPSEWLASFDELLKRCRKELGLALEPQQLRDICRLHKHFRNDFAHFTPKGWSIEKEGLPRLIGAALDAVDDLEHFPLVLNREDSQRVVNERVWRR